MTNPAKKKSWLSWFTIPEWTSLALAGMLALLYLPGWDLPALQTVEQAGYVHGGVAVAGFVYLFCQGWGVGSDYVQRPTALLRDILFSLLPAGVLLVAGSTGKINNDLEVYIATIATCAIAIDLLTYARAALSLSRHQKEEIVRRDPNQE